MSLKQHNDIVEKLLKQLNIKQQQIQSQQKQITKLSQQQTQRNPQTIQSEKNTNKKITQLNKEHKMRIDSLTQLLRNKSTQNKDLKERLNMKKNMEMKEKEYVGEILKKKANMATYDPKMAALVSHYESAVEKKDKYIAVLQKQIKQQFYSKTHEQASEKSQEQNNIPSINNPDHYHTQYQQQISNLKSQINKYKRLFEQKSKEFKDIASKYSELTKDYYKILNEYGNKEVKSAKVEKKTGSSMGKTGSSMGKTGIQNILQEMLDNAECESSGYSFAENKRMKTEEDMEIGGHRDVEYERMESTIQSVMNILEIQIASQIIPKICKLKSRCQEMEVYQNVVQFQHSMLYRLGMGKVAVSEMIPELQKLQSRIESLSEASDLLDQVCFEAGAKRDKLIDKIKDYKATQQLFFTNMKDIKFMQLLPKANKVSEFIEYFELDKQVCELPEQLKKMYEQLKFIERFLKQANLILDRQPAGLQKSLEFILRFLERKRGEELAETKIERKHKNQ